MVKNLFQSRDKLLNRSVGQNARVCNDFEKSSPTYLPQPEKPRSYCSPARFEKKEEKKWEVTTTSWNNEKVRAHFLCARGLGADTSHTVAPATKERLNRGEGGAGGKFTCERLCLLLFLNVDTAVASRSARACRTRPWNNWQIKEETPFPLNINGMHI